MLACLGPLRIGKRVGATWFIKRVKLDGSETDRVMREAEEIGLRSRGLKDFAVKYAAAERQ